MEITRWDVLSCTPSWVGLWTTGLMKRLKGSTSLFIDKKERGDIFIFIDKKVWGDIFIKLKLVLMDGPLSYI